ncbi:MAG: hypothetical protein IMZ64_02345 [Bacteroidetes bacterium]|nr:hypothetical protein [Bacteroidota bacterium]
MESPENFMKDATPTDVFKRAQEEYLEWEKTQPDPNIEQANLWTLLGHQIPGSETF